MVANSESGELEPFDFDHLLQQVSELQRLDVHLGCEAFDPPVDSSDMSIERWQQLARTILNNYDHYDGFVVLHGTDTMAYTASALSFMLGNLSKPVILTGSQLPIGVLRTDGKENLITAIHLAALEKGDVPYIQEVAIYFGTSLYRGNRTHKYSAEDFNAFKSPNLAPLAEAGIHLQFRHDLLLQSNPNEGLDARLELDDRVAVLRLFPGLSEHLVRGVCELSGLQGLVIETYGSGNGPTDTWFRKALEGAVNRGVTVLNVTQCASGFVEQGRYASSKTFGALGIIAGGDMTLEAAVTKLMHVLGRTSDRDEIARYMHASLRGELTTYSSLV